MGSWIQSVVRQTEKFLKNNLLKAETLTIGHVRSRRFSSDHQWMITVYQIPLRKYIRRNIWEISLKHCSWLDNIRCFRKKINWKLSLLRSSMWAFSTNSSSILPLIFSHSRKTGHGKSTRRLYPGFQSDQVNNWLVTSILEF